VDIGGHTPIPIDPKLPSRNLLFLAVFRFLNLWGHFEVLNEFFQYITPKIRKKALIDPIKLISSNISFQ
jgi:hypothetical protein